MGLRSFNVFSLPILILLLGNQFHFWHTRGRKLDMNAWGHKSRSRHSGLSLSRPKHHAFLIALISREEHDSSCDTSWKGDKKEMRAQPWIWYGREECGSDPDFEEIRQVSQRKILCQETIRYVTTICKIETWFCSIVHNRELVILLFCSPLVDF